MFKKNIISYFNVEYIKFFYLLQKVTKLGISNINSHINSHILIDIFINLYKNSNIDCNKKVKSEICDNYIIYNER